MHSIIAQLATMIQRFRGACSRTDCPSCMAQLSLKLQPLVEEKRKVVFVLPGFAAKSANTHKTLGELPDMGEVLSLEKISQLCKEISSIYTPGAEFIIYGDGHVFNDLVGVSETSVDNYCRALHELIHEIDPIHIKLYSLKDIYPDETLAQAKTNLIKGYSAPLEDIKDDVKSIESEKNLFNGIHRFIYEDQMFLSTSESKSSIRKTAKDKAYQVIQRSHAWSALIAEKLPDIIRLSIHPYACGSEKISIKLIEHSDRWATPWHNVILQEDNAYKLVKHKDALAIGARLISSSTNHRNYFTRS